MSREAFSGQVAPTRDGREGLLVDIPKLPKLALKSGTSFPRRSKAQADRK
jgi:hypothetical protein